MLRRVLVGGVAIAWLAAAGCSDSAAEAYRRGLQKREEGHHFEAVETLRVITRTHPQSEYAPKALLEVAEIYTFDLKRFDDAEETYRLFLKLYPRSGEAMEALEQLTDLLFEKKRDYMTAVNECQRYIDSFPNAPKVPLMHRRIVTSYLELRDFAQARVEAGLFLRKFPGDPLADEVAYEIARTYFLEGKPDRAADEARKLLAARPDSPFTARTQFLFAAALEDSDRLPEALEAYQAALKTHPDPGIVEMKIQAVADRLERKHK